MSEQLGRIEEILKSLAVAQEEAERARQALESYALLLTQAEDDVGNLAQALSYETRAFLNSYRGDK